ncbi:MAG: CopD family protein [Nitrosopumilus sp.]|nr:CopD family protein [Nitrosopumilus sp.]MDA7942454.1 CopD family protein [Nitrosopumilus sp.]MDA7953529.1 CopD family protein [Nitrosopumilus sp.]MDA7958818.1 CopD family protein [Nitrosopumilus sp.]
MAALEQAVLTWAHLVSACVWVGGSIFIGAVLSPLLRKVAPTQEERMRLMILVGRRFNYFAVPALAVLVGTGLYSSHALLARPDLLAASSYGGYLALKVVLVAALVAAYGVHVWLVRGSVEARVMSGAVAGAELARLRKRIIILGEATVVISVAVLFLAALLDAGA